MSAPKSQPSELRPREMRARLNSLIHRLAQGERSLVLLTEAGTLAVDLSDYPIALECLKRLDPLSEEARDLRAHALARSESLRLPEPLQGLSAEPSEIVAETFLDALKPESILDRLIPLSFAPLAFMAVSALGWLLPEGLATILYGAVLAAYCVWLIPAGARIRELAWSRPDAPARSLGESALSVDRTQLVMMALALGALVIPSALGLLTGFGLALLLIPLGSLFSLLLLLGAPLEPLGFHYPLKSPPTSRELASLLFAALVTTACTAVTAVFVWIEFAALIPALALAFLTWSFVTRVSGLLSRRILLRLQAEAARERPFPLPIEVSALTPRRDFVRPETTG